MGGDGGFYKFRCKNFLSHDCPNWVYVNGSACAKCCALGRDADPAASQNSMMMGGGYSRQICIPQVEGGILYYTLVEIEAVPSDLIGNDWVVKYKTDKRPQPQLPATTGALPDTPTTGTLF
ncbi:hypothetical protein F4777DRAFT_480802 [Nemania sp. FL0916]|nr:hypothetical protein F4777DRAFT_480802 [Nemania sp. FL0916]